jgi:hypothetical protein
LEGNKPFNKPKYSKGGQKLEENASQVNKIQLDREDLSYPKTNKSYLTSYMKVVRKVVRS